MHKRTALLFAAAIATLTTTLDVARADPYAQGTGGAPLVDAARAPSTPQAQATVDLSTGAATASYPFQLPTARGEAQPSLALRYNSDNGVGYAGVGWTLDVPSIVRKGTAAVPRFVDDVIWSPNFATDLDADDYYVDGQLLVPICEMSSCAGAALQGEAFPDALKNSGDTWYYFRRQIDDGNRYFLSQDGRTWEIQSKSGRVQQLGHPLDGLLSDGIEMPDPYTAIQVNGSVAAVYRWDLVRDTDASGNTVYYQWADLSGASDGRPQTVQYLSDIYDTSAPQGCASGGITCPPSGPHDFAHHVHLTWNIPTQGTIPYLTTPIWQAIPFAELTGVDVSSASMTDYARSMVRRYHLGYGWNGGQTRRFLNTIVLEGECQTPIGEDANGLLPATTGCYALPATTYTYYDQQGPSAGAVVDLPSSMAGQTTPPGQGFLFADFNADGAADFLTGNIATPPIVQYSGSTAVYFVNVNGPAGAAGGPQALVPGTQDVVLGDWLSDGHTNWLYATPGGFQVGLYTSTTAGHVTETVGAGLPSFPNQPSWTDGLYNGLSGRSLDLDGDGLTDIFQVSDTVSNTGADPNVTRAYFTTRNRAGKTTPFGLQTATVCPTPDMDPTTYPQGTVMKDYRAMADFDGDGVPDLVDVTLPWSSTPVITVPYMIRQATPANAAFNVLVGHGDGRFGTPNTDPQYSNCDRNAGTANRWQFTLSQSSAYQVGDWALQWPPGNTVSSGSPSLDGFAFWGYTSMWPPVVGDLNGDGLADYVAQTGAGMDICLRQGASFDTATWSCHEMSFHGCSGIGYSNDGPGFIDYQGGGSYYCNVGFAQGFCSVGEGCLSHATGPDVSKLHVALADVNGDGILDIVTEEPLYGGSTWARTLVGSTKPGLLRTVTSSTGATTTITYQSGKNLGFTIPTPVWAVTQVQTTNNLTAAEALSVTNSYSYQGPVYDGREKQFYGFKQVTQSRASGGVGDPGSSVTTDFATDACGGAVSCTAAAADYSYFHAVRGLPLAIEEGDAAGNHTRTTLNEYTWNWGYTGLDTRHVINEWVGIKHVYLWDGQGSSTTTMPALSAASNTGLSDIPFITLALPTNSSELRTEDDRDALGNKTASIDYGKIGSDAPLQIAMSWALPSGDTTGWNYRLMTEQVSGSTGTPRQYRATYDSQGRLLSLSQYLTGTGAIPSAPNASTEGSWVPSVAQITYDVLGNVTNVMGPNGRCTGAVFDPLYAQLKQATLSYPNGCAGPALSTQYAYDRGLETVTSVTLPNQTKNVTTYDGLGRVIEQDQPAMQGGFSGATSPAAYYHYNDSLPLRSVYVQSVDTDLSSFVGHYIFTDAFGDTVGELTQAGSASEGIQWIVSGVHTRYGSGQVAQQFKSSFTATASPNALLYVPLTSPSASFRYDALGRVLVSTDYEGNVMTRTYAPSRLSVTIVDPEQQTGGLHAGASTTRYLDGHGRATKTVTHMVHGPQGVGDLVTATLYQPTGEPIAVSQTSSTGSYSRSMVYDSLGHMVSNTEPNSGTWVYAYDDDGEPVAIRDARGCGENVSYDGVGRVVAEDYIPCNPVNQATYTTPNLSTGDGTEVFNVYDPISGLQTDIYDRAAHTSLSYDPRARVTNVARQLAAPSGSAALATRYAPTVYSKAPTYYESGALSAETTGADAPQLVAAGSQISLTYGYEGALRTMSSSYGPLVASQTIDASRQVTHRVFGDAASTTSTFSYDVNERLSNYALARTAGPWTSTQASSPTDPTTLIAQLTQLTIGRDRMGNPTSMTDAANGASWAAGAKPQSTSYTYYDDYRLKELDASYSSGGHLTSQESKGDDLYVSPYAAEQAAGSTKFPPAIASPATRVRRQTFGYDGLGNMTSSTDDTGVFLERSLGTIQNGGAGPHQMQSAVSSDGKNSLAVQYDAAGHVTSWTTAQRHTFTSTPISTYSYAWDEVGRLSSASRQDVAQGTTLTEGFTYDSAGQRVLTVYAPPNAGATYRAEVFPSLVLEGAEFANGDYEHDAQTEHVYLGPAGSALAHVFMPKSPLPTAKGASGPAVLLLLTDPNGSTAFVVDHGTGELVERPTYLPYGGVESDFRPARWGSFREDVRFTGHWDDAEVGLVYHGARYYAPQLGRWLSPDPLAVHGLRGDPNVYAYVGGSPIRFSDPFGLLGQDAGGDPVGDADDDDDFPGVTDYAAPLNGDPALRSGAQPAGTNCDGNCGGNRVLTPSGAPAGISQTGAGPSLSGDGGVPSPSVADWQNPDLKDPNASLNAAEIAKEAAWNMFLASNPAHAGNAAAAKDAYGAATAENGNDGRIHITLLAIAFIPDFGAAEESVQLSRRAYSMAAGGADALAAHAAMRADLGLATGEGTLARLEAGGREFWGINAHGQAVAPLRVNAISATHAETDAFAQAARAGVNGGPARLIVDRALCPACGQFGAVRSMARQLGFESLEVVTAEGTSTLLP